MLKKSCRIHNIASDSSLPENFWVSTQAGLLSLTLTVTVFVCHLATSLPLLGPAAYPLVGNISLTTGLFLIYIKIHLVFTKLLLLHSLLISSTLDHISSIRLLPNHIWLNLIHIRSHLFHIMPIPSTLGNISSILNYMSSTSSTIRSTLGYILNYISSTIRSTLGYILSTTRLQLFCTRLHLIKDENN